MRSEFQENTKDGIYVINDTTLNTNGELIKSVTSPGCKYVLFFCEDKQNCFCLIAEMFRARPRQLKPGIWEEEGRAMWRVYARRNYSLKEEGRHVGNQHYYELTSLMRERLSAQMSLFNQEKEHCSVTLDELIAVIRP